MRGPESFVCVLLFALGASALPSDKVLAPVEGLDFDGVISDHYIVHFKEGYTVEQHIEATGLNVSALADFRRKDYLPGYAATIAKDDLDNRVRADDHVQVVEANRMFSLGNNEQYQGTNSYSNETSSDVRPAQISRRESRRESRLSRRDYEFIDRPGLNPYGTAQIAANGKLNTPVPDGLPYRAIRTAGKGVDVYVFDSGIRTSHKQFQGRAVQFNNLKSSDRAPYCKTGENLEDIHMHGHGTHVAGIIGADFYGVAFSTNLIAVKVLCGIDGTGDFDSMANAIADVTAIHSGNLKNKKPGFRGSVINMSLSFKGYNKDIADALKAAKKAGIHIFAGAGNDNGDAKDLQTYPCGLDSVSCIGASNNNYARWDWGAGQAGSNYGAWINFIAPGENVLSCGKNSDTDDNTMSGTSMATPHVSGIAAIMVSWLALCDGSAKDYIWWNTQRGIITGFSSTSNNLFTFSGIKLTTKYAGEPFRWAGQNPKKDGEFKTLDNHDTGGRTSDKINNVATAGPAPAGQIGSPLGPSTVVGDISFGSKGTDTTDLSQLQNSGVNSVTPYTVKAYSGFSSPDACSGNVISTFSTSPELCLKPTSAAACFAASTSQGLNHTCGIELFSDTRCKDRIYPLANGYSGLFGGPIIGDVSVGGGSFSSMMVQCSPWDT